MDSILIMSYPGAVDLKLTRRVRNTLRPSCYDPQRFTIDHITQQINPLFD